MLDRLKKSIKSFLPRTLFMRSLLILITPILLLQILTTYIFYDRHWEKIVDRLAFAVAGEIAIIADQVEASGGDLEQIDLLASYYSRALGLDVFFEPQGEFYIQNFQHDSWGRTVTKALSEQIDDLVGRPHQIKTNAKEKWVEVTLPLENGVLTVVTAQRRLFSSSAYIFLLWMSGISFLLLIIAILFMRNQIRPIRRLAIAAEKFGKGRDVPFLKIEGAREVRSAAQSFVDMRQRIDRQIQQRTAMLAGVSHDLRTPLTRMKLELELLGNEEVLQNLKQDVSDMEKMINAYLDFARGEGGEESVSMDLSELINTVLNSFLRAGRTIEAQVEENVKGFAKPVALERCFSNLIDNACKYAQHVQVRAYKQDDHFYVEIEDDGPGIPLEMREDVFKPFFRGEASRNLKTGGTGLGLPIAQDIILAHGGTIKISDPVSRGTLIQVSLPL
jgi:two-component system osmolarity sensor histidine kinase EnvZ